MPVKGKLVNLIIAQYFKLAFSYDCKSPAVLLLTTDFSFTKCMCIFIVFTLYSSLEPLFESSRLDEELRQLVKKTLPEFCRQGMVYTCVILHIMCKLNPWDRLILKAVRKTMKPKQLSLSLTNCTPLEPSLLCIVKRFVILTYM